MNKILLMIFGLIFTWNSSGIDRSPSNQPEEIALEQKKMLLGEFGREDLEEKPYSRWFNRGYRKYRPDKKSLKSIKKNIDDYEILIVIGTWCPDTKIIIPAFFKIMDEVSFDSEKIKGIGVDQYLETPFLAEKKLKVKSVPTIIFYKKGKEVSRFAEYPQESLEEDLAAILSQEEMKNRYADFLRETN